MLLESSKSSLKQLYFFSFLVSNRFIILLDDLERVTVAQSLISRNIPSDSTITFRNVQSGYVILEVLGPKSRQLLQSLTQTSLDDSQFSVNTSKVKDIFSYRRYCNTKCY